MMTVVTAGWWLGAVTEVGLDSRNGLDVRGRSALSCVLASRDAVCLRSWLPLCQQAGDEAVFVLYERYEEVAAFAVFSEGKPAHPPRGPGHPRRPEGVERRPASGSCATPSAPVPSSSTSMQPPYGR